ncbi:MAG: DsrE family protein [Planctomycetaceae bacterium]|nr:DsrE family protein [Planctomycetaceae bacterium]
MTESNPHVLIMLTVGKADNGKNATMAFSCGMSALAMGHPATIFLTSDGSVWGFQGSAEGIRVQGFPPLEDLIAQYLDAGGDLIICSVCHKTCSTGNPHSNPTIEMLPQTQIGGFATIIDRGMGGMTVTF